MMKTNTPYWNYSIISRIIILFSVVMLSGSCKKNEGPTTNDVVNSQWEFMGKEGISAPESGRPDIEFSPSGGLYLAYEQEFWWHVLKFNGTQWEDIVKPDSNYCQFLDLAIGPDGTPYLVFDNLSSMPPTYKLSVKKFNGTNWVYVGSPDFTEFHGGIGKLVISSSGEPYLGLCNCSLSHPMGSVMKFNGTEWVYVGQKYMADQGTPVLAFNPSGELYAAYSDGAVGFRATVMKFNGIMWGVVGRQGFSDTTAYSMHLEFSPSGQPFVAFIDGSDTRSKISVMTFDGASWSLVGLAGFNEGIAWEVHLKISPKGEPVIAFQDVPDIYSNGKTSVMKFDGVKWNYVGVRRFCRGGSDSHALALDATGRPYVSFREISDVCYFQISVMRYTGQ